MDLSAVVKRAQTAPLVEVPRIRDEIADRTTELAAELDADAGKRGVVGVVSAATTGQLELRKLRDSAYCSLKTGCQERQLGGHRRSLFESSEPALEP